MPRRITQSSMKSFQACPMRYKYRYVDQIVPDVPENEDLYFGSTWHMMMEMWYSGDGVDAVSEWLRDEIARQDGSDATIDMRIKLEEMFSAYAAMFPLANDDFVVVEVEKGFEMALTEGWVFAGKPDGLVRNDRGYFTLEHKTTRRLDDDYKARVWQDLQIHLYGLAQQTPERRVVGAVYNVARKPAIQYSSEEESQSDFDKRVDEWVSRELQKPRAKMARKQKDGEPVDDFRARLAGACTLRRKVAEPEEDFRARIRKDIESRETFWRQEIYYDHDVAKACSADMLYVTGMIDKCRADGYWPHNRQSCQQFGRNCDYWTLCTTNHSEAVKETEYKFKEAHEELI